LGGKSLGRIDIRMDHRGIPHFMEANLMPGLRKGYFYRSCVLNLDMSYEDMILVLLTLDYPHINILSRVQKYLILINYY